MLQSSYKQYLVSFLLALCPAEGVDWQVVSEVILAVMRRLYSSAEEQHSLGTGVGPGQNALLIHTAQHLCTGQDIW